MVAVMSLVCRCLHGDKHAAFANAAGAAGHKNDALFDPSGLMATARTDGRDGMIFISLNYRLGLFGWLNGDGDEDVFPNVALQDQLFALKW